MPRTTAHHQAELSTITSDRTWPRIAIVATLAVGFWPAAASAQTVGPQDAAAQPPVSKSFVYETEIYQDTDKTVVEAHTTIFVGETVFDWQEQRALIADFTARKIYLLNAQQQVQTSLDFTDMEWRLGQTKIKLRQFAQQAGARESELLDFLLDPAYVINGDDDSQVVSFQDRLVTYTVSVSKPKDSDVRQKLARFLDVTTRLSALQSPQGFARMPVNNWLNEHGMAPMRVERATSQGSGKATTIRSQHQIREEITDKDRTKIDEVQFWMKDFRSVTFDTYQNTVR